MKTLKTITPYLLWFVLTASFVSIFFRLALSYSLEAGNTTIATIVGILYGVCMFILGWVLGNKEADYLPIYHSGFRFHLATYIIHNAVSELWFAFGFNSTHESVTQVHYIAAIWAAILLLHLLLYLKSRKKSINDLDRRELFE